MVVYVLIADVIRVKPFSPELLKLIFGGIATILFIVLGWSISLLVY